MIQVCSFTGEIGKPTEAGETAETGKPVETGVQVTDRFCPLREEEPLFKAIREGDAVRVKELAMRPGTNLMLPSKPGWLAVHQAAWFGEDTCLRMLLSGKFTHIDSATMML